MKKYIFITALIATFAFVGVALANPSYFAPSYYLTDSTATTSPATVGVDGTAQSFVADSYLAGNNTKIDEAYLLTQAKAATVSSTTATKIGITIQFATTKAADGTYDWYTDNTSTSSDSNPFILGEVPNYTLTTNVTSSSTRMVAIKVPIPTRYIKITYTGLTATSSVWAELVPTKERN